MAITIVATAGASNANSYVTEAELTTWIENRLHNTSAVSTATSDTKKKALVHATRLLDEQIEWKGDPSDADVQALQWPRYGLYDDKGEVLDEDTIPQRLKNAQMELSCDLIDSNRTAELSTDGIKKIKAGPVELEFKDYGSPTRTPVTSDVIEMVDLWIKELKFQNGGTLVAERG